MCIGIYHYGEVLIVALSISSQGHLQCAVMPYNFIFLSIQFIMAKRMRYCIVQGSRWLADLFQVYVNSYIALLNARYYTQPNADSIDSFELRRKPPSPGLRDMSQEKFPSFRRSFLAHPDVEVVPPTQPLAVVMVCSCVTVVADEELMQRSSHAGRFWWR